VGKTKEEKIRSEKDNNSGMTMPKSFDFEDMWSFNHPHLSVKDFWKQLRRVEVFIEKRKFPTF
jgi:hypothetical protein